MAESVPLGEGYQPLLGLQDIKTIKQLSEETVRDILRASQRDSQLQIVTMGQLTDMSGTNDAFNSSICSLEVTAGMAGKTDGEGEEKQATNNGDIKVGNGNDSTSQKTFHFVIKSPPNQAFIRLMHKLTKPFLNEVTWYLELLKQISLLKQQLPEPLNSRSLSLARQCPVVYHAHSNYYSGEASNSCTACPWFCSLPFRKAEEGILVMENVKKRGFVMFDKMRILPLDHFLLAMTNLAHFHGRWLAYRWKLESGELSGEDVWSLEKFKSALDTQKRAPQFVYKQLLNGTAKTTKKILELEDRQDLIPNVRQFFNVTARQQLNRFMGNVVTPIDTCCHGDFWSNNIMFKYDQEGKVAETILVDFQLINYGHPAYDVLYLLYLSTDSQFRSQHMEDYLHQYWETLNEYIDKFAPADTKYDWQDFQNDLNTYKTIGFVLATTLMPNVLSETQLEAGGLMAIREMQRKQAAELQDDENRASKEIRRRITGLVEELVREKII